VNRLWRWFRLLWRRRITPGPVYPAYQVTGAIPPRTVAVAPAARAPSDGDTLRFRRRNYAFGGALDRGKVRWIAMWTAEDGKAKEANLTCLGAECVWDQENQWFVLAGRR
jgi:hypothetical protein